MKPFKKRRQVLFSFCFLFLILTASAAVSLSVEASTARAVVSPALYILAEDNGMAMAGLKGNHISLDREDFARAMNLSKVHEITVTQTPPITDGELRVGRTVLTGGQTVSGANLDLLSYVAKSEDITTSSFRFRVGDSPLELTCSLYLLDRFNSCPTLSMVPEACLNVSTHRNITLYGTLPCYDPDGDQTTIEIVSYPENGILVLTDAETGDYTYTPRAGSSGRDSFTYVARDKYGNYSASATVSLTVTKPTSATVFSDLEHSPAHNAALTLSEAGIMSGTQVGTRTYFYPDRPVSRGEFVEMAMHTLGHTDLPQVERTVFADDSDIPTSMKAAVAEAYRLGYIKGEPDRAGSLCFYPDRAVTRAEAAVILSAMLKADTPTVIPVFADSAQIPAWAAPSLYSMNALGIMVPTGGQISPLDDLTRGDTARILSAVLSYNQ